MNYLADEQVAFNLSPGHELKQSVEKLFTAANDSRGQGNISDITLKRKDV